MIRKALVVCIVALALLGAVLGIRTANFPSRQVNVEPVPVLELDEQAVVQRLSKAITFETVSYQDPADFVAREFRGLHAFLARSYPGVHSKLKRETINDYTLVYTWPGSDPSLDAVLLLAHMDVVPMAPGTEDRWEHGPFEGLVDDEFVWGRGALDDKVNMMAILEAVELHVADGAQPERTLILAFGHDEEVGGPNGAVAAAAELASRGIKAEFILDEGGAIISGVMPGVDAPVASVGVAEKGYVTMELTVKADGGHSSQPPTKTAIGTLSRAIHRLQTHQMPGGLVGASRAMFDTIGPEMPGMLKLLMANLWLFGPVVESQMAKSPATNAMLRTTTAPTILEAGVKENVLPAIARGVVNFRILPGESIKTVLAHIKRVVNDSDVDVQVLGEARNPSKVSPHDGPSFGLIERTIREIVPDAIVTPYLVIGGTDARHYGALSDNIYRFSPLILFEDDLKRMHGTNERISKQNYLTVVRFYHRLIETSVLDTGGKK